MVDAPLMTSSFQSTHPSGVRLVGQQQLGGLVDISIHAPQWGATIWFYPRLSGFIDFNPRTPVGCDAEGKPNNPRDNYFNPRTPVGCDTSDVNQIRFRL